MVVVPYEYTGVDFPQCHLPKKRSMMALWVFLIERLQMCKKDRNGKDGPAVNTEPHGWASKNQSFHFRNGKSKKVGWLVGPELTQVPRWCARSLRSSVCRSRGGEVVFVIHSVTEAGHTLWHLTE